MRSIGKLQMAALFLFLCGIMLPITHVSAQGTAQALVVSRGNYGSRENNLSPGPENDGENFRRVLRQAYGESMDITSLEKAGAQTQAELTQSIQTAFSSSDSGDINYFFYSGHGESSGMWLGGTEFFSAEDLANAFSGISGTNFLVLDCCYSGNLITKSASAEYFSESFVREFQEALAKMPKSRSAVTNSNFHILVASAENEMSVQGMIGERGEEMGLFTSAVSVGCGVDFSKVSSQTGYSCAAMADGNRDGGVTLEELYQFVGSALQASHAAVWPEGDSTVFLPVEESLLPDAAVTDVQLTYDEMGIPVLDVSYTGGENGVFQAALYKYNRPWREDEMSDLEVALIMTVESQVTAYPNLDTSQAGSWEFTAGTGVSHACLPLGVEDMEEGDYFLLINKKDGNTGCYLFPLQLGQSVSSTLLANPSLQVADHFSVETDGTLAIQIDFGNSAYPNCYACPAACTITNSNGTQVYAQSVQETQAESSDGKYRSFCSFSWDGRDSNGQQVEKGTYTVSVSAGSGSAAWSADQQIQVESQANTDISWKAVELSAEQFNYDGKEKIPDITIAGLENGKDYLVTYEGSIIDAGTVTLIITGIGNYSGTIRKTYQILPASVAEASIKVESPLTYTGKALKADVNIKYGNSVLQKGTDYKLSYANNKKPGFAKVTIRGKGNYGGSTSKTFKIRPAAPKTLEASAKGKNRTVRWKKVAAVDGYVLQYSTRSDFTKNVKKEKIPGRKQVETTVTVSSAGKQYYFRIRSYSIVDGKKIYSAWKYS